MLRRPHRWSPVSRSRRCPTYPAAARPVNRSRWTGSRPDRSADRLAARQGSASPAARVAAAPRRVRPRPKPPGHWRTCRPAGCRPSLSSRSSTAVPGTVIPGLPCSGSTRLPCCHRSSHPGSTAARRTAAMPAAVAATASSSPRPRCRRPGRERPARRGKAGLVGEQAGSSEDSNREHSLRPGGRTTWILMPQDRRGSTRAAGRRRG